MNLNETHTGLLPLFHFRREQIKTFNKDNVSNALMTKVKKYVNNPDFSFENVAKVRSKRLACRHDFSRHLMSPFNSICLVRECSTLVYILHVICIPSQVICPSPRSLLAKGTKLSLQSSTFM